MAGSVAIVFGGIAGEDEAVSPALPRVLQLLARRGVRATFYIDTALAESEPFASTMIENGGHSVGKAAPPTGDAVAGKASSPAEWHAAMQVAIGRAVQSGERRVLLFELAALERGDAIGLFDETLDLVAGLRRAGSLEVVG